MKLLVLTAIVAAVASTPLPERKNWPWQVGKEYVYNVNSYTWIEFENGNGNAFKTQFIIHVQKPGLLLAKLVNPLFAQIQGQVRNLTTYPSDLKYEPVQKLDGVFEIIVDGGRVLSVKVPAYISVANENLLKALISALQVDLSAYGHINNFPNNFDKETFQGRFKKTEADITGDCETLYHVSPVPEILRLSAFPEDQIEIFKTRNYGSCKKRVGFSFGVPESVVWNKITYDNEEKQFIKQYSARMLAGKQGTIYKSETLSFVSVKPLLFGKQEAEVYSSVRFVLAEVKPEANTEWKKLEVNLMRESDSLLFLNSEASFFQVNAENIVNAKKLLQEITPLLENPSNLPKAHFLSKFNLIVRFIMFMDADQLAQMTSSIEVARTSENISKNKMWVIYRDAVAQAGSIAAFEEIKAWILTKKVQGNEAAELIASLAGSLGFYNEKVLTEFFELAFNPVVVEQKYLNTSTLLAATRFIRSSNQELFVVETVIPRLSLELKKAIEEGDSSKAQVYIRSLSNLARPEILKVFAPYLEGRIAVTNYLRTQIVISLETLAKLKNEDVRAVLYSILKNTAEPYEVRVAAALNIFLAVPTPEMMQVMAHMTNNDPSTQVRGVLASSIDSAANLKDPRFAELAKTAQAVLSIVNKEKYGYYNAADHILDEHIVKDNLSNFMESSFIASENSFLPKYYRQALSEEDWISLSISDVQQLINYIKQAVYAHSSTKSDADFKFSAKKIIEELQIKREPRKPLEGAFLIDNLSQQELLTFTEKELVDFISLLTQNVQYLLSGQESQFTKVEINKKVIVTFPLATGMPFVFAYTEPTVFIFQGKANNNLNADKVGTLNTEISITYARNLEGSVGFYDTFTESCASSGVINKFQIYVPAKINAKVNGDLNITFLLPEQEVQLVQFSVSPYTTVQKIRSPLTVAEDPATNLIKHGDMIALPPVNLRYIVGIDVYMTGYTYTSVINTRAGILSKFPYLLYQNDDACIGFEIVYVPKDTMNKEVTFTSLIDDVGTLEMKGQVLQHDNFIYYEVDSRYGNVLMGEGELYYYPYEMTFYTPITDWKTYNNWYTGYQYTPYCVVDISKILTFSGRSYDYSLTSSWHAVMVDVINEFDKLIDLKIFARRPSDNQAEVCIFYKHDLEIDIKPTAVEVYTNTEKITEGKHTIYMNELTKTPLLEYYTIADGVQVFLINNEAIRVVYDSYRLVIFTAEHLDTTGGVCSQSSSEISDDYKTIPFGLDGLVVDAGEFTLKL